MIQRICEELFKRFLTDFQALECLKKDYIQYFTSDLLTYFHKLGQTLGYKTYGSYNPSPEGTEYLVDQCWYVEGQSGIWMELALEQELSYDTLDSIKEDFEKLLDIKAFVKVGIFIPRKPEREDVLKLMQELIVRHMINIPGEQYLIIFLTYRSDVKPKSLEIEGHKFDFLGNRESLGSRLYPWE